MQSNSGEQIPCPCNCSPKAMISVAMLGNILEVFDYMRPDNFIPINHKQSSSFERKAAFLFVRKSILMKYLVSNFSSGNRNRT